jgi:CheY-like chemotaxis protein
MDGYELARRVREDPRGADLCLVAVTGYGGPEERAHAREAGFDAQLDKPVDLEALDAVLRSRRSRAR